MIGKRHRAVQEEVIENLFYSLFLHLTLLTECEQEIGLNYTTTIIAQFTRFDSLCTNIQRTFFADFRFLPNCFWFIV